MGLRGVLLMAQTVPQHGCHAQSPSCCGQIKEGLGRITLCPPHWLRGYTTPVHSSGSRSPPFTYRPVGSGNKPPPIWRFGKSFIRPVASSHPKASSVCTTWFLLSGCPPSVRILKLCALCSSFITSSQTIKSSCSPFCQPDTPQVTL